MEEKGQVSCQGYKAKLVIIAGIRKENVVKIRNEGKQSRAVWGTWGLVNASGSERSNSLSKTMDGEKLASL